MPRTVTLRYASHGPEYIISELVNGPTEYFARQTHCNVKVVGAISCLSHGSRLWDERLISVYAKSIEDKYTLGHLRRTNKAFDVSVTEPAV